MKVDILAVTPERALRLLKTAGSKLLTEESLESDLEAAGIVENGTFSLVDLAAFWVRLLDGGLT